MFHGVLSFQEALGKSQGDLTALRAQGWLAPIGGADGEGEAAPSMEDAIASAAGRATAEAPAEAPAETPEAPVEAPAETPAEDAGEESAPDEAAPEGEEATEDEVKTEYSTADLRLAVEIAQDPTHPDYEIALDVLEDFGIDAPEVDDDSEIVTGEEDSTEQGEAETDVEYRLRMVEAELKAERSAKEQEQEAAEQAKAQEKFYNDLSEHFNDGKPFPQDANEMTPDQRTAASVTFALGDPVEAKELLETYAQSKIDAYVNAKPDPAPVPITDRNATNSTGEITNVRASIEEAVLRASRTA